MVYLVELTSRIYMLQCAICNYTRVYVCWYLQQLENTTMALNTECRPVETPIPMHTNILSFWWGLIFVGISLNHSLTRQFIWYYNRDFIVISPWCCTYVMGAEQALCASVRHKLKVNFVSKVLSH